VKKLADMFKGTGVESMARFLDGVGEQIAAGVAAAHRGDPPPKPLPLPEYHEGDPVKKIYLTVEDLRHIGAMKHGPFPPGEEGKFKAVAWALVDMGRHPTPTVMNAVLGHVRVRTNSLSGREAKWLRQVVKPMRRRFLLDARFTQYGNPDLCDLPCCGGAVR
jgi:hypothetical protein